MPLLNKYLVVILLSLLTVTGCHFYGNGTKATDFSLVNWDGKTVTMDSLRGKVVIVAFSYAYCSVRCPIITGRLAVFDEIMKAPRDVVYLHVGIDPENDTLLNRKKYFNLYGLDPETDTRWLFVSGQRGELTRVREFYGIKLERFEEKMLPEGYYIEYTPKIVVIDKQGSVRYETDFNFMEEKLAGKIEELL